MKFKLITVGALVISLFTVLTVNRQCNNENIDPYLKGVDTTEIVNSSPSIQMYFYIKRYADQYCIPEAYAFSLAYQETRYGGLPVLYAPNTSPQLLYLSCSLRNSFIEISTFNPISDINVCLDIGLP